MAGKMSRNKGQRAEREFIKILQEIINFHCGENGPELKRNLMQTQNGGYDIVGLEWAAIEIKHQETLNIKSWWEQTMDQCGPEQTPILAYKQNRRKWRVMTLGSLLGVNGVQPSFELQCPVDIALTDFLDWFHRVIAIQFGETGEENA